MKQPSYSTLLIEQFHRNAADLREQYHDLLHQEATRRQKEKALVTEGIRQGDLSPPAETKQKIDALGERISQLEQIRSLMKTSPGAIQLIDETLGNYFARTQRRQQVFAIVSNVIFLLLGWALSLIGTPASFWQIVRH